jgi:hypothetical protein
MELQLNGKEVDAESEIEEMEDKENECYKQKVKKMKKAEKNHQIDEISENLTLEKKEMINQFVAKENMRYLPKLPNKLISERATLEKILREQAEKQKLKNELKKKL